MSYGFCYVIQEGLKSTDYCKLGTTFDNLYQRLRMLQQGNPRDLRFQYLFIGDSSDVCRLESIIKNNLKYTQYQAGGSRTEWYTLRPRVMRDYIRNIINENNLSIYEITNSNIVPYNTKSYKKCYVSNNYPDKGSLFEDTMQQHNSVISATP